MSKETTRCPLTHRGLYGNFIRDQSLALNGKALNERYAQHEAAEEAKKGIDVTREYDDIAPKRVEVETTVSPED